MAATAASTISKLKKTLRVPNAKLVGAAIGTGMAAQAAARGGADFLLALNAGRLRSMGAPSITSLLALRNSNDFVMEFALSEILPQASLPVFFGACVFDPRQSLETLVDQIAASGFDGLANFPTAVFLDPRFRAEVERVGVGFNRELEMFAAAKRRGLATLAYIHTPEEAVRVASIGVDVINLSLGWHVDSQAEPRTAFGVDQASDYAKQVFRKVRAIHPGAICLLEGGPIVKPDDMYRVCSAAKADGYVGGSTIDRVAVAHSIEHTTSAFKTVGMLERRINELERELGYKRGAVAIVGRSESIRRAIDALNGLAASTLPVLITGEPGTGKRLFARAIHDAAGLAHHGFVVPGDVEPSGAHLFGQAPYANGKRRIGHLETASGATVLIADVDLLSRDAQGRLFELLEIGRYRRLGDDEPRRYEGRLIFTTSQKLEVLKDTLLPQLVERLTPGCVALPPLRERLEDLPLLCEHFLKLIKGAKDSSASDVDYSAFRALLSRSWPGNIRELRTVLETAAVRAAGGRLLAEHLPPSPAEPTLAPVVVGERSAILDALQRHRFRRGETARFLGISRKTLYNKMKAFGVSVNS